MLFLLFSEVHVCLGTGLDFHEDLHRIGAKEGLKGRKLQKAMESYAWNITVLKVGPTLACLAAFSPPGLRCRNVFSQESLELLWGLTSSG